MVRPSFREWFVEPIISLVYPTVCPLCGHVVRFREPPVCPSCLDALPRTEEATHRDNKVEMLFADFEKFVRGAAWLYYYKDHPVQQLVHAMKFQGQPELGLLLGRQLAMEWADTGFFDGIDYLAPIPLHRKRYADRGYNQSEWIARGISEVTGLPLDTTHLYRQKNNEHQSRLSKRERTAMQNVFAVRNPSDWSGCHILVIDDIITTGNTISRAFSALHSIRGCRYSVLSLAVAQG